MGGNSSTCCRTAGNFERPGDNLFVQGFTWDADYTVLTTHEKRPREPGSGIELEGSLPAYPILKKNSEQILDRANGIWFASSLDPFVLRHPAGEPLAEIVSKASRSNSQVYDINPYRYARLVDREGSIWIGDPSGVHRFSYSPLMQLATPQNATGPYFALAPDEGGVGVDQRWNRNGSSTLYRVAGGKAEFQKAQRGLTNFAYRAPDKTFWFGGEGGLWHMVNGRLTRIELPPAMADKLSPSRQLPRIDRGECGCHSWHVGCIGLPTVFGQNMEGAVTFRSRGCISSLRILLGPHLVRLQEQCIGCA